MDGREGKECRVRDHPLRFRGMWAGLQGWLWGEKGRGGVGESGLESGEEEGRREGYQDTVVCR